MTFEREYMGLFCLGVVWINVFLIVSAALKERGELVHLLSKMQKLRPGAFGLTEGTVTAQPRSRQDSFSSTVAAYRLTQSGRTRGDGRIYFHDRQAICLIKLFELQTANRTLVVSATSDEEAWVWPTSSAVEKNSSCPGLERFNELEARALIAQDAEQIVEVSVKSGDNVFVAGTLSPEGETLTARPGEPLLVSLHDPRQWLKAQCRKVLLVALLFLLVGATLTAAVLLSPGYGVVTKLSALAMLLYFLLVQPAGVALSESIRLPHEAKYQGIWKRSDHASTPHTAGKPTEHT